MKLTGLLLVFCLFFGMNAKAEEMEVEVTCPLAESLLERGVAREIYLLDLISKVSLEEKITLSAEVDGLRNLLMNVSAWYQYNCKET